MAAITYPRRLHNLAVEDPEATALTVVTPGAPPQRYTRAQLDQQAAAMARALESDGVTADSVVLLALPNGADFVVCAYAAWWIGSCVLPLSTRLMASEQAEIVAAAAQSNRPLVAITASAPMTGVDTLIIEDLRAKSARLPADPFTDPADDRVPFPGRALPSGGTSGRPKIIVDTRRLVAEPDVESPLADLLGRRAGRVMLVVGPVYHSLPFGSVFQTLFERGEVVLMTRFDPVAALDAIEAHRVTALSTVPVHLQRMARVPGVGDRDLSSIVSLYHSGAVCPEWVKRRWFELVGPEHVYEGFGSTEAVGFVIIRGDEWLEHPGSVGRGITTEVAIRGHDGTVLPPGEIGEIFMRWRPAGDRVGASLQGASFRYWGSEATAAPDGYVSVGDLGWLDEQGYLFVADRRIDMVITGGVNVYPAEVETVLIEHPDVEDIAVIGVPDPEWGRRVHAIVAPRRPLADGQAFVDELGRFARTRLSSAKQPKTYEIVASLPRSEAGKVRRGQLAAERETSGSAVQFVPSDRSRAHAD